MILNERDARHEHVIECAKQMMTAARTAPKAKGVRIFAAAFKPLAAILPYATHSLLPVFNNSDV
jgi:hypothetical protein